MILQALKQYIQNNPGCSLHDLSVHFAMSEDASMAMLNSWVKRGKLNIEKTEGCAVGSCHCDASLSQVYLRWCDDLSIGVSKR
ncbi:ferrous iron transport protein C [Alginatibacterium sediminis]|uniref:Ferrous iron transport protein C n=1 Tax=Alginatibacterium sediminis TaxID=2164068 RepID=A0A420EGJ7_9ALTE|nr:FeoC-like transcriptional regulator [Alginatibacterium sediminis]RKF19835.1 ferrous iron transport protein C [Alginatibacterium sediminis]